MALQILTLASLDGRRPSREERSILARILLAEKHDALRHAITLRYNAGDVTREEAERLAGELAKPSSTA
jgi:hypothetical protein